MTNVNVDIDLKYFSNKINKINLYDLCETIQNTPTYIALTLSRNNIILYFVPVWNLV